MRTGKKREAEKREGFEAVSPPQWDCRCPRKSVMEPKGANYLDSLVEDMGQQYLHSRLA
jgi:hypothetical protein